MSYVLFYTSGAKRDYQKLKYTNLADKVLALLKLIEDNPYYYPPEYEILTGDMKGLVSRRINKQHRLVYQVLEKEKQIKIVRMYTHYE